MIDNDGIAPLYVDGRPVNASNVFISTSNRPGVVLISIEKNLIDLLKAVPPYTFTSLQQLPQPLDVLEGGGAPPMPEKLGKLGWDCRISGL